METMKVLAAEIHELLQGRKTYLLAGLLLATVLVLVLLGRLTPETAMTVALVFAGLVSATLRSAMQQHHAEVLNLLIALAETGTALKAGNREQAVAIARAELPAAEALVDELKAEGAKL